MKTFHIAASAASAFVLMACGTAFAQDNSTTTQEESATMQDNSTTGQDGVQVLSSWVYDPLYEEGWSVDEMFYGTDIVDATGEEVGDVENVIFGNDGEVLGIIAQVGGFWDIGDTHVYVPWDEVKMNAGIQRIQIPVTEETVDDYDVFGDGWFDEEMITEADTDTTQAVDDDLVAGSGIFKASDLIGDFAYLSDNRRYGYVSDLIVQNGSVSAIVIDSGAYGRRGYYAYPYAYRSNMAGPRYDLPYEPMEIDTLESFDYNQLKSRVTQ